MSSANHMDTINSFAPMSPAMIATQPVAVWREVETVIHRSWNWKCKSAHMLVESAVGKPLTPAPHQPGWLTVVHIETLDALDVPVSRAFTAVAMRHRAARQQESAA